MFFFWHASLVLFFLLVATFVHDFYYDVFLWYYDCSTNVVFSGILFCTSGSQRKYRYWYCAKLKYDMFGSSKPINASFLHGLCSLYTMCTTHIPMRLTNTSVIFVMRNWICAEALLIGTSTKCCHITTSFYTSILRKYRNISGFANLDFESK